MRNYGIIAGFPDIFFLRPCGGFSGLFIELKAPGVDAKITADQQKIRNELEEADYRFRLCYGASEAIREILDYEYHG